MLKLIGLLTVVALFFFLSPVYAQDNAGAKGKPARKICRVKLVSEVEPEMTSIDAILKSIIKPGMNDEQKTVAVMKFVNSHIYWAPSDCGVDHGARDPIVLLNSYCATICQQDAAVLCPAFWTALGYDARFWQLKGHTTSEVFYGGKWRNMDATFNRVYRNSDGSVASVKEKNRMYKPGISKITPWDEFEVGHRLDINLRKGESLTRHWGPVSKDKNYWRPASHGKMPTDRGDRRRALKSKLAKKPYRTDSRGTGYANGIWLFEPDLSDPDWKDLVCEEKNITAPKSKDGYTKPSAGKTGTLVFRVHTPYIITGGSFEADLARKGSDAVSIFVSTSNGMKWKEVWKGSKDGTETAKIPVRDFAGGKFSYLVKIEMKGAAAGVKNIKCKTIVQVNPLSLPALKLGENTVNFDLGKQLERITFYPNVKKPEYRDEIIKEENIGTAREQMLPKWVTGLCVIKPKKEGYIISKVTAPAEITSANWGGWLDKKGTKLYYSFDGKDWKEKKPSFKYTVKKDETKNHKIAFYEAVPSIPKTARTVYFKYSFWRKEPKELSQLWVGWSLRADLEYVPKGLGGFPGAKVTYCWFEETDGKQEEKKRTEAIKSVPHKFKVNVGGKEKPLMKWVKMEYGSK